MYTTEITFRALKYFSFTNFSEYWEFVSFTAACGHASSSVLVRNVINKNGTSILFFFLNNLKSNVSSAFFNCTSMHSL